MTERNLEELKQALLEDQEFVEALGTRIGVAWGFGENPIWFFDKLVKKVQRWQQRGAKADARIIPQVFSTPEEKEMHRIQNDLRSLRRSVEGALRSDNLERANEYQAKVNQLEERLAELRG